MICTFTGKSVDPANLRPELVCIEDIAHHLALINRFTGATRVPYSVAQHCVMMSYLCTQEENLSLECLLHDATEAYLGDVSRPLKRQLHNYQNFEQKAEAVIRKALGLPGREHPIAVKQWDNLMLVWEASELGVSIETKYEYIDVSHLSKLTPWGWRKAESEFLKRYEELTTS